MSLNPKRTVVDNGAVLVYQRMPANPFVAFHGSIWAGAVSEEKKGVAEFASQLLMSGTKIKKAAKLSEAIESLGATLDFSNSQETMHFYGRCPRSMSRKLFAIVVDCLSNPTFPDAEVERVRGEIIDGLRMDMDNTTHRASKDLIESLYPKHLYGKDPRGEESDVKKVKRADIASFHSANYGPKGMIIALSGDVDGELIKKDIAPAISKFDGYSEKPKVTTPGPAKKTKRIIAMPHKSQADIAIGLRAVDRHHEDFYALSMVNLLFGRIGLYGRLGRNLRDEQGLAYYSYSSFEARPIAGHWNIIAGVNPANVQRAVKGISKEIEKLHTSPLTKGEIADGMDNQVGALNVNLERNAEMAAELYRIEYFGLGLDYLKRFPSIVRSLTLSQIHGAADKYIRAEDCSLAIAGPVSKDTEKSLKWP